MNRELIELVLFGGIFCFQVYFFVKTLFLINQYKQAMPLISQVIIVPVEFANEEELAAFVDDSAIADQQPDVVEEESSDDYPYPASEAVPQNINSTPPIVVSLIQTTSHQHYVTRNIVDALNKYLARNRHAAADFSLMQDIVERNTGIIEEEINLTLSTPLYLGLMGTMAGIILGIYSMSDFYHGQIDDKNLTLAIAVLLASVKVAMITSCLGLVMTIFNSAVMFKKTKYQLEEKKNHFYNFLQIKLLPLLNQGIGATFDSLQRNLSRFNEKFDTNLDRLTGVFDKNYESILLYKELLQQLDRTKIAEITKYNVQVLKELNNSVGHFQQFNSLFGNLNQYVNSTYALADKSTELLKRTDDFGKIAESIEGNLDLNTQFMQFLTVHFSNLESHRQKVEQAVDTVSFGVKDNFDGLMRSIGIYSQELTAETAARNIDTRRVFEGFSTEMREALLQQTEVFRTTMSEQTDLFNTSMEEKKSKLDYLEMLEPLLAEVKAQRQTPNQASDTGKLHDQLAELTTVMSASLRYLKRIEKNSKMPFFKKIFAKKTHEEE